MSLNPDISKQAHEVVLSRKNLKTSHPSSIFNNIPVSQVGTLNLVGISLDIKLNFDEYLRNIQSKVNRIIGIISNLENVLPRSALLTTYKSFTRPHLDYGDIIYDKAYNESFKSKLESIDIMQLLQELVQ